MRESETEESERDENGYVPFDEACYHEQMTAWYDLLADYNEQKKALGRKRTNFWTDFLNQTMQELDVELNTVLGIGRCAIRVVSPYYQSNDTQLTVLAKGTYDKDAMLEAFLTILKTHVEGLDADYKKHEIFAQSLLLAQDQAKQLQRMHGNVVIPKFPPAVISVNDDVVFDYTKKTATCNMYLSSAVLPHEFIEPLKITVKPGSGDAEAFLEDEHVLEIKKQFLNTIENHATALCELLMKNMGNTVDYLRAVNDRLKSSKKE